MNTKKALRTLVPLIFLSGAFAAPAFSQSSYSIHIHGPYCGYNCAEFAQQEVPPTGWTAPGDSCHTDSTSDIWVRWTGVPEWRIAQNKIRILSYNYLSHLHLGRWHGLNGGAVCSSGTCTVSLCGKNYDPGQYRLMYIY